MYTLDLHRVGAIVKGLSNECIILVCVMRDILRYGSYLSDHAIGIVQVDLQRNVYLLP